MKNLIMINFLIITLLVSEGCSKTNEEIKLKTFSAKEGKFEINENEFVRMYFTPESGLIDSYIELIIENNSKGIIDFGHNFILEYFDNESWREIKLDIEFPEILLGLSPEETHKGQFNLSLIEEYNKGEKGIYRYVKRFGFTYEFPEITDSFILYSEFEIK